MVDRFLFFWLLSASRDPQNGLKWNSDGMILRLTAES
jgi:hypothetical protein